MFVHEQTEKHSILSLVDWPIEYTIDIVYRYSIVILLNITKTYICFCCRDAQKVHINTQ